MATMHFIEIANGADTHSINVQMLFSNIAIIVQYALLFFFVSDTKGNDEKKREQNKHQQLKPKMLSD